MNRTVHNAGLALLAVLGCVLMARYFVGLSGSDPSAFLDLQVYRDAIGYWRADGSGLYDRTFTSTSLPFLYPPFALVMLAPTTWVSLQMADVGLLIASLGATFAVALASVRRIGFAGQDAVFTAIFVAGIASVTEPFWSTLLFGQVNVLIMLAVVIDVLWMPPRWRGLLTGLVAGIKLTPLVFVLYFAWKRDGRAVARLIVTFLVTVVVGIVATPSDSLRFFSTLGRSEARLVDTSIVTNQSLRGVFLRLLGPGTAATGAWVAASLVLLVVLAIALRRSGSWETSVSTLLPVSLVAVAGLLISPISWTQHWVWCLPLAVTLLGTRSLSTMLRICGLLLLMAVTVTKPLLWMGSLPRPMTNAWWDKWVASNICVIVGIAILMAVAATRPPSTASGVSSALEPANVESDRVG